MTSKNYWKIGLSCFASLLLCGLTPQEKIVAQHARTELKAGAFKYKNAEAHAAKADQRAAAAQSYAATTYNLALGLQGDIDAAYKREKALVLEVNDLRELKKRVYAHWGLGAFAVGFGILAKHLLILAAVVIVLLVAMYALSFVFPLFGVALRFALGYLKLGGRMLLGLIKKLISRKNDKPAT